MSANAIELALPQETGALEILQGPTTHGADQLQATQPFAPVICYRDPADVRMIRRQSRLIILCLLIVAIAAVGMVYKSIQRPDRIVVDMSSGRTVTINDRELGATEAVKLEKDKLQLADMDYVVKTFLDYLYRVDQRSRSKDIEAALRLMVPNQAKKFAQYLTDQKVLQTQREQQWNATWKPEYLEHAPGKPLTVKVYGTQDVDMVVKNSSKHVTKHVLLTVELMILEIEGHRSVRAITIEERIGSLGRYVLIHMQATIKGMASFKASVSAAPRVTRFRSPNSISTRSKLSAHELMLPGAKGILYARNLIQAPFLSYKLNSTSLRVRKAPAANRQWLALRGR